MDNEKQNFDESKIQGEDGSEVEAGVRKQLSTLIEDISLEISKEEKRPDTKNKNLFQASISISNFKRIRGRILIADLDSVNYFVGRNGSGKSSILTAISALNSHEVLIQYLQGSTRIELSDLNEIYSAARNSDGRTAITPQKNLFVFSHGYGKGNPKDPERGATVFDYNLDKLGKDAEIPFWAMNGILEELNVEQIRIVRPNGDFSPDIGFSHDGHRVRIIDLADGLKVMIELNHFLSAVQRKIYDINSSRRPNCFYVLIEEPENHLHPTYQKLIPELLRKYCDEISVKCRAHVRFFVTTHSPFVIGAASHINGQKVYILDDGKLVSYDTEKHTTTETSESSGFTGPTCSWIVSRMLGADVVDFGYPENYCLLEENSLYQLLKACVEKGLLANYQFIAARGASVEATLEEKMNELSTLDSLIKCNPYYWNTYRVIMDNTDRPEMEQALKTRVERMKKRLGSRFVELSKDNLEDYYINFGEEFHERVKNHLSQFKKGVERGKPKEDAAKWAADLIHTREDFSKLFEGELDFLFEA